MRKISLLFVLSTIILSSVSGEVTKYLDKDKLITKIAEAEEKIAVLQQFKL